MDPHTPIIFSWVSHGLGEALSSKEKYHKKMLSVLQQNAAGRENEGASSSGTTNPRRSHYYVLCRGSNVLLRSYQV